MSRLCTTWDVTCPKCGAAPHQRCTPARGYPPKFHRARTREAQARRFVTASLPELRKKNR